MKWIFIIFFTMSALYAQDITTFCQDTNDFSKIKQKLNALDNQLSFRNKGGLFNGGVCWWHSRFTRNATYIVRFDPTQPEPSIAQAKIIIKRIKQAKSIVIIPGFNNLYEFSRRFENTIQKQLEKWQLQDGFLFQKWVLGLAGRTNMNGIKLKKKIKKIYTYFKQGKIPYVKLQLKGIAAHAWLITDMIELADGYQLQFLDSNYQGVKTYTYKFGDRSFYLKAYGSFVPYLHEKKTDMKKINKSLARYCK